MNLAEVLKQPEGFTPPDVTVTIEKVFPYKSGESENGPWSFQDVQVVGGKLKLKNLPEFPESRVGQTVTIRANQSKQHGLTGLKVAHEKYQNKTYDKLIVTGSAKWAWATNGHQNGHEANDLTMEPEGENGNGAAAYREHILACAQLAEQVANGLVVSEPAAVQACFATICIDTKNRGLLLTKSNGNSSEESNSNPDEEEDDTIPF